MLEVIVDAGPLERVRPLISVPLPPPAQAVLDQLLGERSVSGLTPGAVWLDDVEAPSGAIAAQLDPDHATLSFVLPGVLAPGRRRRFQISTEPGSQPPAGQVAPFPVQLREQLDRVVFQVGAAPWAVYNVRGSRRPYFWPLLGPDGASVVRGQGTGEHPHHTGMGLAYGGHSEGGSANIWSDWDEPPYGPGGRMLHGGFQRLGGGPVYGELVQRLTYVDAFGEPIVEEVRTIRCWFASSEERYLDFQFDVLTCRDRGPRPFLFMIRLPGCFDVPKTGRVTNAVGHPVPPPERGERRYHAAWVDGSGPSGDPPPLPPTAPPETLVDLPGAARSRRQAAAGPWNGIAILDHPQNAGFPNLIGNYAVTAQLTQTHYPPPAAPDGPFSFRQRVFIHAGNADVADVSARAADYAEPCTVEVRLIDEPTDR